MKSIRDINVSNKRVLVRVDFNVTLDKQGNIVDDFRIKAILPTIEYLIENHAKVILMSPSIFLPISAPFIRSRILRALSLCPCIAR